MILYSARLNFVRADASTARSAQRSFLRAVHGLLLQIIPHGNGTPTPVFGELAHQHRQESAVEVVRKV